MAEMTPMMRQYMEIKEQNKDSILFFRLGDFYEMFGDDARKASRELDLTLTTRDKDKNKSFEEKIPMCGIPYHASDAYIARLIAKGYKVAICEQTEDPAAAKGLVERDIVRIVTPGTVIDSACLEEGRSNFCAGIYLDGDYAGFSVCDISTGQTHVTAFSGPDREAHLQNELGRFAPAEAVLNPGAAEDAALRALLEDKLRCHVERLPAGRFQLPAAEKRIRQQFGDDAAQRLPRDNPAAMLALGALLDYLHDTQKTDLEHVDRLDYYRQGQFMELDLTARRQRMRWSQGYLQVFRDYGARLLRGIFRGSFSCFDMSMAIMPAFVLSTVSILVNLTLGVVGALAGDNLLVAFESVGQMLLNMYLTLLVLGGITTVTEWNQIRTSSVKKFVYVFTFPLFMFTYIPISLAAFFCKPQWKPIEHRVSAAHLRSRDRQEVLPF